MKKLSLLFTLLVSIILSSANTCKAQSSVMEVSWNVYPFNYTGLLVLFPNNQGIFKVVSSNPVNGTYWVEQDATLTNQFDMYGNCTSYIYCRNPRVSVPNMVYAADNFVIFPNGAMYTQDAAGAWSTQIVAQMIPTYNWAAKLQQYSIYLPR